MTKSGIKFICDFCGDLIEVGRPRFIFKGELYCAYDGGNFNEVTITSPENIKEEMQKLIEIAEQKDEKELSDEVYYPFKIDLCRKCRDKLYKMLEHKSFKTD